MSISTASAQVATLSRYRFVAAGGETSITGVDANGNVLTYTVGMEQVYLNGVMLVRGQDYTATSGSSITGLTALVASDVVEVLTFSPFTITNAVDQTLVNAKGDLIVGTADNVVTNLTVGTDGQTLVANSANASGLGWNQNFAAGKNKIINGDFGIWQRGTSFSNPAFLAFNADRWQSAIDNVPTSQTISRQTFTPGTAPVSGYEGQYFWRSLITTVGTNTVMQHLCTMENVQTYAGQTATVSFWAKADSARNLGVLFEQNFGSGGSGSVQTSTTTLSLTTAWTRFTVTIAIPSISGKTVGASSFLRLILVQASASGSQLDLWGVQVEAGSTATAFQTATGTLQGELAACQRYLPAVFVSTETFGFAYSTTGTQFYGTFGVTPRVAPTGLTISSLSDFTVYSQNFSSGTPTAIVRNTASTSTYSFTVTTTAGSPTLVTGQPAKLQITGANGYALFTGCEL